MKNYIVNIQKYIKVLLVITMLAFAGFSAQAQNGDPPPPPDEHGENGNQVPGGGAPVGEGVLMLCLLSGAYGGFKLHRRRKLLLSD